MTHSHLWLRLPVTDFTCTYVCDCGERHKIQWAFILPHVSAVDQKVMDRYGGIVNGEAVQSWDYCLSKWMLAIDQLGLRLYTEGLDEVDE